MMGKTVILLPTYNERENVTKLIPLIFSQMPQVQVMVVDDDSPDGTAGAVETLAAEYPNVSLLRRANKEGLGKAYMHAFGEVLKDRTIDTIVMMDADLSHHPSYLPEMLTRRESHDVVIGSRYVRGGSTEGWETWRLLLSFFGNHYARLVTGLPIHDLTAGFIAINTEVLRRIPFGAIDSSGYAFIIELKYLLAKAGARFAEIPIVFRNRAEGESKISSHIISEGIIAPWKIRFR